jgi:hypothetical protein
MVRPMLLAHIDDLIARQEPYRSTLDIYEELVDRWLSREANRQRTEVERVHFKSSLRALMLAAAKDMHARASQRKGLVVPFSELEALAKSHSIQLSQLDVQSRSLLNRNAMGDYKFAHKSIAEYALAVLAIDDVKFAQSVTQIDGLISFSHSILTCFSEERAEARTAHLL